MKLRVIQGGKIRGDVLMEIAFELMRPEADRDRIAALQALIVPRGKLALANSRNQRCDHFH
jgi:hypothetical protein